jgi:hypothetical protein
MENEKNLIGKRISLIRMEDPYTNLKEGDEGVISGIDSNGDIEVDWDNGSTLKVIPKLDEYKILDKDVQSTTDIQVGEDFIVKFSQFGKIFESVSGDLDEIKNKMQEISDSDLFQDSESIFEWEIQEDVIIAKISWQSQTDESNWYFEWAVGFDEFAEDKPIKLIKIFSSNLEDTEDELEEFTFGTVGECINFLEKEFSEYLRLYESNSVVILEKNVPLNSSLWSSCKEWAKQRYEVWPSAYAVGAAAKRYKEKGGRWKKGKKKTRKGK